MVIISVGNFKNKLLKEIFNDYFKRIKRYISIKNIIIKDSNKKESNLKKIDEENKIISYLTKLNAYTVCLSEEGNLFSTKNFSDFIKKNMGLKQKLCFIIGGSDGFSDTFKQKANIILSLSKLTFPHELARVILIEQIYRSIKIIKGEPYHK